MISLLDACNRFGICCDGQLRKKKRKEEQWLTSSLSRCLPRRQKGNRSEKYERRNKEEGVVAYMVCALHDQFQACMLVFGRRCRTAYQKHCQDFKTRSCQKGYACLTLIQPHLLRVRFTQPVTDPYRIRVKLCGLGVGWVRVEGLVRFSHL